MARQSSKVLQFHSNPFYSCLTALRLVALILTTGDAGSGGGRKLFQFRWAVAEANSEGIPASSGSERSQCNGILGVSSIHW